MKKILSMATMALAVLFASCSQDDTLAESSTSSAPTKVSFSVNLPSDAIGTRADDDTPQRYIMQLYSVEEVTDEQGNKYNEYEKQIINPTKSSYEDMRQIINTTGVFNVDFSSSSLTVGDEYVAVFWADYDETTTSSSESVYNTYNLYSISVNYGKEATEAFCGSQSFTYGDVADSYSVTMKRAVAKINVIQSKAVTFSDEDENKGAGYITFKYNGIENLNLVESSSTQSDTREVTKTIKFDGGSVTEGQNLGSFYAFAPIGQSSLTDFEIYFHTTENDYYSGSDMGGPTNVPLQANYITNIKGTYITKNSSTFTATVSTVAWDNAADVDGEWIKLQSPIVDHIEISASGSTLSYSFSVYDNNSDNSYYLTSVKVTLQKGTLVSDTDSEGNTNSWYNYSDVETKTTTYSASDKKTNDSFSDSFTVSESGVYRLWISAYNNANMNNNINTATQNAEIAIGE